MEFSAHTRFRTRFRRAAVLCLSAAGLLAAPPAFPAQQRSVSRTSAITAFQPGETLTYDVNWSNLVKAGTSVMEVKEEKSPGGRELLRFVVTSRTEGVLGKLYPLGDTVESVFDPKIMESLSYSLVAKRKGKTRRREMVFDHKRRTAVSRVNDGPPETAAIPEPVQDSLSAVYYLRTREDLAGAGTVTFDVFDAGTLTPVEVRSLGKETVKTPAGEFSTIKVGARKGLFMSDGGVVLWLTDDSRKIPVRIETTIPIGSLIFTLTDLKPGRTR